MKVDPTDRLRAHASHRLFGRKVKRRLRRLFRLPGSRLTHRVLAVNLLAPLLLVAGLLYLDRYQEGLVLAKLASLHTQASLIAAAIGESALEVEVIANGGLNQLATPRSLSEDIGRTMIRRLAELVGVRARLFDHNGILLADSRKLDGPGGAVQVEELPPPEDSYYRRALHWFNDKILKSTALSGDFPLYVERANQTSVDYDEVIIALDVGESSHAIRATEDGGKVLSYAVPVQFYKQVVGAVMVSDNSHAIDSRLFEVRLTILQLFTGTLALTVLMSFYLAGTIARPIRRLAEGAEHVRHAQGRELAIPDLTNRRDEIGDLSEALREMTEALWSRMDAIERFAADVAHEIKNPLTSLRSAVETVARISDPEQQKRLMNIIQDDVKRLDRLISDISDASRLDAELSRAEGEPTSLRDMLLALRDIYQTDDGENAVKFELDLPDDSPLTVIAMEGRLVQVFRNLIGNAISFSPPGGKITLSAHWQGDGRNSQIIVRVRDQGPGIPPGKEDKIFDRFYSDRPDGEKFGTHSGLGLAISKQIVEAIGGHLVAGNDHDADGAVKGACFTVELPAAHGNND